VDLSDGLADAAHQIAQASQAGVVLDAEAIPVDPGARDWFTRQGQPPLDAALAGGEDYELLFAVPPRQRRNFLAAGRLARPVPVTRIGTVTEAPAVVLRRAGQDAPLPRGFAHFGAAG
jgi:thiamine-monophosphate kinase